MVNTGIYVRVSTEEQAREGYSIRGQEEKLKNYAILKEWHVYSVYSDEGISGKDIDGRPEVKRLISDIEGGKVENVLVFKIDRLTRSTKNLIELMDLFNKHDCAFNSLSESIDTSTASGRMFLKIVGIFAEFERENLVERLRLGFERKVKEGYALSNYRQAYGYEKEKGSKILEVNEKEAEIVKRIYNMYLNDDYTLYKIAKTLTAQNVSTKAGKRWASITIKDILQNPVYIGKVRYSVRDESRYFEANGRHTPIIDEDTFYGVQNKIKKIQAIARKKRPSSGVYFAGVLVCVQCGCRYTSKWDYRYKKKEKQGQDDKPLTTYPTYRCTKSNAKMGCESKNISHKKLEESFLEYIANIGDLSAKDVGHMEGTAQADHNAEMKTITAEIALIERKSKEIMNLFMSSVLEFSEYKAMRKTGNERRKELEERLEQLSKSVESSNEHKRIRCNKAEIVANLLEHWQAMDNSERQQFIQKFIKKIAVHAKPPKVGKSNIVIIDEVVFNEF